MNRCVCPECGATYPPHSGHCRGGIYKGCCQTFVGEETGEKHRVGPHNPTGQRRCLTVEEMVALGWRETSRGWTHRLEMTDLEKARLKGAAPASNGVSAAGVPNYPTHHQNASTSPGGPHGRTL